MFLYLDWIRARLYRSRQHLCPGTDTVHHVQGMQQSRRNPAILEYKITARCDFCRHFLASLQTIFMYLRTTFHMTRIFWKYHFRVSASLVCRILYNYTQRFYILFKAFNPLRNCICSILLKFLSIINVIESFFFLNMKYAVKNYVSNC